MTKKQATCLLNLATSLATRGKLADAEPHYRQALTLYQGIPNTERQQATCLHFLANTLFLLGQLANAEPYYLSLIHI